MAAQFVERSLWSTWKASLFKCGFPGLFYRLFSVFSNKHDNFNTNKCEKNAHPVYSAGIRTHNPWIMSVLP